MHRGYLARIGVVILFSIVTVDAQELSILHRTNAGAGAANCGRAVAFAGDIDKDGYDDFIVGSPGDDSGFGVDSGRVRVFSGKDGHVILVLDGRTPSERLGVVVAGGKDVDGDGVPDIVAGSINGVQGRVRIFSGQTGSLLSSMGPANGGFGHALAMIDDTDGDGKAEWAVGSPFFGTSSLSNCGRVQVFRLTSPQTVAVFTGNVDSEQLGRSVASAGDIDGDGTCDIAAGAPYYDVGFPAGPIGRVQVFSPALGSGTAAVWSFVPPNVPPSNIAHCGESVASAGDLDGDGKPEIICGAPNHDTGSGIDGHVYVVSGDDPLASSPAILFEIAGTTGSQERLGTGVAGIGDITNDGVPDIAVAAHAYDDGLGTVGRIALYSGASSGQGTLLRRWEGTQPFSSYALTIASGGDANGDGIFDLIVGADLYDVGTGFSTITNRGQADVVSLADSLRSHTNSTGAAVEPGHRLAVVGDVDGDGFDEYAIGRPDPTGAGTLHGVVRVHDGATGLIIATLSLAGSGVDEFGFSVAGAGDFDGDGKPDLIVGAPGFAPAGRAYVYSGATWSMVATLMPQSGGGRFGHAVARGFDVSGDGIADVMVGDPEHAQFPLVPHCGAAYVFLGPSGALMTYSPASTADARRGTAVAGLGDLDGDGFGEWAFADATVDVGTGQDDSGRLWVLSGNSALSYTAIHVIDGTSNENFGSALIAAGDVDCDGIGDFTVGGPGCTTFGIIGRGRVRTFSGATGALIDSRIGDFGGDRFGTSIATGDFDGDGRIDFAAGAPFGDSRGEQENGYAILWSGADGHVMARFEGPEIFNANGARLGRSMAGPLRCGNDRRDDLLIASTHTSGFTVGFRTVVTGLGELVGAQHYGTGTPGCRGQTTLSTNAPPRIGTAGFAFTARNVEPMTFGFLLATVDGYQVPAGFDPTGTGIILYADWTVAPVIAQLPLASDACGFASAAAPIPDIPSLAGFRLTAQAIWYSSTPCPGPAFGYSTSNGLDLEFQP